MSSATFSWDYVERTLATVVAVTVTTTLLLLVIALGFGALWRRRRTRSDGAIRRFAEAIAMGDLLRAEYAARAALAVNDSPPGRTVERGFRLTSEVPIDLFDAHAVVRTTAAKFAETVSPQAAFATLLAPCDRGGVVYLCGSGSGLWLDGLVERWGAPRPWLEFDARGKSGVVVEGCLEAREVVTSEHGRLGVGLDVWVHLEVPANRDGRLALSWMRPVIEEGLVALGSSFDR